MLKLKTLGGWALTDAGGVARPVPTQRMALLALLAAAGERAMSRDRVAGLLWPESTDEHARHSLGQSLYALRRDARSADVVLGTTTVRLNPEAVTCDAWELEAAASAGDVERVVALYQGPFLDGVHLRGSAALQQAIDTERDRLAKLYTGALETRARTAARCGDADGAVAWWRRLAAADPLSSRIALELVRALAAAGDRTAALHAARVHDTLVRQELDAAPDPALVSYVGELRTQSADAASDVASRSGTRVTQVRDEVGAAESPPVPPVPPVPLPDVADRSRRHGLVRGSARRLAIGAIAAAGTLALLLGARRHFRDAGSLDPRRVYVASFDNRTNDRVLDPIGDMASDWVTHGLEQSGIIAVAFSSRARDGDLPAAPDDRRGAAGASRHAAELGAGTLVSGAYYVLGDSLRFHVQISDVERGELLASFDVAGARDADPSVSVDVVRQRTIGSLASLLDPRLQSWVRVATKPPTYDAYREFVIGNAIWGSDHRRALAHFVRAAAHDSTFYVARVKASILHRLLGECARTDSIAASLLAVRDRLAPYDYHVLEEQVAQCRGDWERAYGEARAVADLRPGSAFLDYGVAIQALQLGRFAEAEGVLGRHHLAQATAEVGPNYGVVYAHVLAARGRASRAIDVARWARGRFPEYASTWAMEAAARARGGGPHAAEQLIDTMATTSVRPPLAVGPAMRRVAYSFAAAGDTTASRRVLTRGLAWLDAQPPALRAREAYRFERAQLLYAADRLDEAQALFTELARGDSMNVDYRGHLGLIAARCGDAGVAASIDGWLVRARPRYVSNRTFYRARMAALRGEREQALALLGRALDEMGRFTLPAVREQPDFASLRNDRRFTRLAALR